LADTMFVGCSLWKTFIYHFSISPGADIIKHYGFVIYGKWPDFAIS